MHRPTTCDALGALIAGLEETVVRHDVRLVVIDSMASLVRKEFGIRSGAAMVRGWRARPPDLPAAAEPLQSDLLAHEAATLKRVVGRRPGPCSARRG